MFCCLDNEEGVLNIVKQKFTFGLFFFSHCSLLSANVKYAVLISLTKIALTRCLFRSLLHKEAVVAISVLILTFSE